MSKFFKNKFKLLIIVLGTPIKKIFLVKKTFLNIYIYIYIHRIYAHDVLVFFGRSKTDWPNF